MGYAAAKSKISIDLTFSGAFNIFNTVKNTIVDDAKVNTLYAALLNGQVVQGVNKEKPLIYISEASYSELLQNNLTKINQINVLFEVAQDTEYLKKLCPTKDDACVKQNSLKFVAGYLKARHGITLSASTLEEMWQVYK